MADQKELDRMNRVAEYINRYYEFDDAVEINKQNKEYLKTYIHDPDYVEKNFDMKSKVMRDLCFAFGAGVVAFAVALLFMKLIIAAIIGVAVLIICVVAVVMINKSKLNAAQQEQLEVNSGIKEQMQVCDTRAKQIEKQRADYKKGLEKRLDFMSFDYIGSIDTLKGYLENGEAETCEEAVELLEQNMLMKKMSDLMTKSSRKPLDMDFNQQKEKFGDPLALIKEKKKKKR